ncbi:shikimate dehydrogenase [Flexivirga sp. ID2601S]|uniref:Shikimate dehydrogenase n=1 Tax=Flexivirga aerilata TaxID=1656889 RepID=A0A849ASL8_9MICO|nr:shikimate dehydrogenase [Flexivirga aerilata]NNG41270.1 shikimate dehydrogenase [Flexivirga aerilata]
MIRHRAGVLGKPIAHSLSPVLHRAAYAAAGLDDWSYDARECDASQLPDLIAGLGPTWRGLSLTMPLKEEALLLASSSTPVARQTGAVNTLVREGSDWVGDNTDVVGIRDALCEGGVADRGPVESVLVIGSGATARSALAAVAELGVTRVTFAVRGDARESTLAQARDHGMDVEVIDLTAGAAAAPRTPLVINTTPGGAADGLAGAMAQVAATAGSLPAPWLLLDVVYAGWPTPLAAVAATYGAHVIPGVEMLIHQAAAQFTLMTGKPAPLQAMRDAGRAAAQV